MESTVTGSLPLSRLTILLALLLTGCSSSPDITAWRHNTRAARQSEQRGTAAAEIERVDRLRAERQLADSRELIITLATEQPSAPEVLWRAARAESDAVLFFPKLISSRRDYAALSALDYAERAVEAAPDHTRALGELAWALGASTHLQPMLDRSKHAQRTLNAVETTLELDPEQRTAQATLAILRLRLATLPWIARTMAWGAPKGDLNEAKEIATALMERDPTLESRLLLAKIEHARENLAEAQALLQRALEADPVGPRDDALRDPAEELLVEIKTERAK